MDSHDRNGAHPLVLVVDDDAGVSAALSRQLRTLGYEVLVAANGAEGLDQALRAQPAVVFADVRMPGMDGHALLKRLMRSGLQASVVLMSGQGELDDAIAALREGAVDYLKKPWTRDELVAVLTRATELFAAYQELSLPPPLARSPAQRPGGGGPLWDAGAFVEELAGRLTAEGLDLPALWPAVARLRKPVAGSGPDESLAEVAGLIAADATLREPLRRTAARTPDLERQAGDIGAIVTAMGREAVHALVETVAFRQAFPIRVGPLRTLNDCIWRFSVSRAMAMRGIADVAESEAPIDGPQCYLGGLLLDVGASYLLAAISREMERVGGGISDPARMIAAVGTHHARVGSFVIQRWGLPPALSVLVRDHHADSPPVASSLWCAAALGGAVAVHVTGFGDPTGDRELRPASLARCAYTLGVGDTVLRRLTKSLVDSVNLVWAACA